jgi:predicted transcriptional regulator
VDNESLVTLTADITAAFVSNNRVPTTGINEVILSVHAALAGLNRNGGKDAGARQEPAVAIRSSVKPDYIICLEDGKKLKMLKRHLMTHYQLTPQQYREKWNLKPDYPMVAPNYAETRKALALKSGLGRKSAAKSSEAEPANDATPAVEPKRRTLKVKPAEAPPAAAAAPRRRIRKLAAE